MSTSDRVVRTKVPAKVIVTAVLVALFVAGFLIFAVYSTGSGIIDARQRGTITAKEFRPFENPERQLTLNRDGAFTASNAKGEYLLTVTVQERTGGTKDYTVWINDPQQFENLKVGDSFDVGPYLVPSKK